MRKLLTLLEASRGFGYAIDYAKEIARNEQEIARFERLIQQGVFAPASAAGQLSALDLLIVDPAARRKLGFADDEVATVAAYYDYRDEDLAAHGLRVPDGWNGADARRIADRIEALGFDQTVPTEAQVRGWLATERQRLARHRRNQKKHG